MEKTISVEEFHRIKIGDKVRIISEQPMDPFSVQCYWASDMNCVLGKVCTVASLSYNGNVKLVECPGWEFSQDTIVAVYPYFTLPDYLEQSMAAKELNDTFIKIFKDLEEKTKKEEINIMKEINKVIYNDPATIVIWKDGTKTTCKCDKEDKYDREKGLALCVLKKILGGDQVANMLTLFEAATDHEQITWQQAKKKIRKNK